MWPCLYEAIWEKAASRWVNNYSNESKHVEPWCLDFILEMSVSCSVLSGFCCCYWDKLQSHCAGSVWKRVNFCHSSWCRAKFLICAGNNTVNSGIILFLSLLLSSAYIVKSFSAFPATLPVSRLGAHKWVEGDTVGNADQRNIPHHMMSYLAWESGGRRNPFKSMTFIFPSNHNKWWSPATLEMVEYLSANEKWWMNSLVSFTCMNSFYFDY